MKSKRITISIIILLLLSNVILLFLLFGETFRKLMLNGLTVNKEILRVSSPDGKIDAVVIESSGGLPAELITDVFVVKKGRSATWKMGEDYCRVFEGRYIQGLSVKWEENKYLELRYIFGSVDFFKNNITFSFESETPLYVVEIREKPINDSPLIDQ